MSNISKRLPTLSKKFILPGVGLIALIALSTIIVLEATKATVVFAENGEEETITTHARTVAELLDDLGIEVGERDVLSVAEDEKIKNGLKIAYDEAKRVYITIDDITYDYYTTDGTIADLFDEADLEVTERDDVSHNMDQKIFHNLHVEIDTAFEVVIEDAGEKEKVWSTGDTVKNVLSEHDIQLDDSDVVKPKLTKKLTEDETVSITRINKKTETIEESVAYQTETKKDGSLKKGNEKVVTEGEKGERIKKYEVISENGEEKERKLVEESITKKPVNKVVAVGTKTDKPKSNLTTLSNTKKQSNSESKSKSQSKPKSQSKSKSSQSNSNKQPSGKEYTMTATAYTINCDTCDGRGITATGINLHQNPNVVAVDPKVIPLGSKVWVEGYGYAVAGDTGGAINGNRIDVHVSTRSEAAKYGMKSVKVIVVD